MERSRGLHALTVALLAILPYLPTLGFPFVFDDLHLIVQNRHLREAWSPLTAFVHHFWHGTPYGAAYYRPMVTASLALNGRLFGWGPAGFHLVNILLHTANACLLMFLAQRLRCSLRAAFCAAALFAVHPVAAWPVASIVARVDLLPAFFLLCASLALAAPGEAGSGRPFRPAFLVGLFFLLALLSKETALAFLVVPILTWHRVQGTQSPGGADGRVLAAVVASLLVYLGMRQIAGLGLFPPMTRIDPLINPLAGLPLSARLTAAVALAGRYIFYLLAPVRFSDPRNYFDAGSWPHATDADVLAGLALGALWVGLAAILWQRRDPLALPVGFALACFLPASNIVLAITSLYAQNFLYLPLLGLCLAGGLCLERLRATPLPFLPARWRMVVLGGLLLALALASSAETRIWKDGVALFSAWTQRFPFYPPAHSALGVALLERGDLPRSKDSFRRALDLSDQSFEAHYNLGVALLRDRENRASWEEALRHLRRATDLAPTQPLARANAGRALLLLGYSAEAAREARGALRLSPDDAGALAVLIDSLLQAGDLAEARGELRQALSRRPHSAWLQFSLARVEARSGRTAEALSLLSKALARDPATRIWIGEAEEFDSYRGIPEFDRLITP